MEKVITTMKSFEEIFLEAQEQEKTKKRKADSQERINLSGGKTISEDSELIKKSKINRLKKKLTTSKKVYEENLTEFNSIMYQSLNQNIGTNQPNFPLLPPSISTLPLLNLISGDILVHKYPELSDSYAIGRFEKKKIMSFM